MQGPEILGPKNKNHMPQLIFRKNEALVGLGGLFATAGGLLLKILPDPLSFWIGGLFVLAGLVLVAYGYFGLTSSGRILNRWNAEVLHRALQRTASGSTIRILQTSVPDVTKLIGVLEELLLQKNPLHLHLLLLDHEQAPAVLAARVQLRVEKAAAHTQEVKTNIEQFIALKQRVDAAWRESMNGATLDLQIRLYTFLPFGSVFQIGQERIISGLFWNWTSSVNGPMIVVSDKDSKAWKCFEQQLNTGWKNARPVFPVPNPVKAEGAMAKADGTV